MSAVARLRDLKPGAVFRYNDPEIPDWEHPHLVVDGYYDAAIIDMSTDIQYSVGIVDLVSNVFLYHGNEETNDVLVTVLDKADFINERGNVMKIEKGEGQENSRGGVENLAEGTTFVVIGGGPENVYLKTDEGRAVCLTTGTLMDESDFEDDVIVVKPEAKVVVGS